MKKMFNFKKPQQIKEPTKEVAPARQTTDTDLLKKQIEVQSEIIRELVTTVTWIANHKRYEHIQEKLIVIHNLMDKLK